MQIHELPSGTPTDSDLLPFDTGEANYKTPFSGFDVGENTATFTSGDDDDPQQFKTVDLIETGPLKTVLNRLSMAASNIRYLGKLIGNSIMGTSATTITGAISELKSGIGSLKSVNLEIGYVDGETVLAKVQRAFAQQNMPKGVPFVANVHSGSYFLMTGYWYSNENYGFCYVQNFSDAHFVELDNNTWKITSNNAFSTYSTVAIKIGSGASANNYVRRSGKLRILHFYYVMDVSPGLSNFDTPVGTVASGDIPYMEETAILMGLTSGEWKTATYVPCVLSINGQGQLYLRGNLTGFNTCRVFRGQLVWVVA